MPTGITWRIGSLPRPATSARANQDEDPVGSVDAHLHVVGDADGAGTPRDGSTRLALGAFCVAAVPIAVSCIRALASGYVTMGDNGLLMLRAHDVFSAHPPLLGTWSSASIGAGFDVNNPGPLQFDLLAPFVRLFGVPGLAVGASVLNVAAVGMGVVAARRLGRAAIVSVALAFCVLGFTMGDVLLHDPWQPHNLMFPFLAFIVVATAVAVGELWATPVLVGLASLVVQAHASFVFVVGLTGLAGLVLTGARFWRTRRPELLRWSLWGVAVAAVCWIQPVVEQLFGAGRGNLDRVVSLAMSSGEDPIGFDDGSQIAASVIGIPGWFPSTFSPQPRPGSTPWSFMLFGPAVSALLVVGVVGALLAVAWLAGRGGDARGEVATRSARSLSTWAFLVAVAVVAAWVGVSSSPPSVSGPVGHQMRWLWVVSIATWTTVAWALQRWLRPSISTVAVVGLAVAAAVAALVPITARAGPDSDRDLIPVVRSFVDQLRSYDEDETVLVDVSHTRFGEPFSGPLLGQLALQGITFNVTEDRLTRQVGNDRRADGTETVAMVLVMGSALRRVPQDATVVAESSALTGAERAELDVVDDKVVDVVGSGGITLNAQGRAAARAGHTVFPGVPVAPGDDATAFVVDGGLGIAIRDGYYDIPAGHDDLFERYGELVVRWITTNAMVYTVPITPGATVTDP